VPEARIAIRAYIHVKNISMVAFAVTEYTETLSKITLIISQLSQVGLRTKIAICMIIAKVKTRDLLNWRSNCRAAYFKKFEQCSKSYVLTTQLFPMPNSGTFRMAN
jgi:hypothetical protein